MMVQGELGSLIHLVIAVALSLLYVKKRAVVILPAIMLASLIGVFLGLEVHPFLKGISSFAAALIVFVAGLELDPEFVKSEKERVTVMAAIETILFLTFFYLATSFLQVGLALTLSALVVSSNETFAIRLTSFTEKRLAYYGITLSVFEDILAVFLLSIGMFTLQPQLGEAEISIELATILALIPLLYMLSGPFNKLIRGIEDRDSKILLSILYLAILIALSSTLSLPEAVIVFIGAVMLSWRGFDEEAFKAIESYFSLALLGFVATLPYLVPKEAVSMSPYGLIEIIAGGLAFSLIAFFFRSLFVFLSSIFSGIKPRDAIPLSLSLGNTGEFGLIVIAYLITATSLIPAKYAYMAMFAYAFNLTLVSVVVRKMKGIMSLVERRAATLINPLLILSKGGDEFVKMLSRDVEMKRMMVELAIVVMVGYVSMSAYKVASVEWAKYLLGIIVVAASITSLQKLFRQFGGIVKADRATTFFFALMRFIALYVIVAPLMGFMSELATKGELYPFASPISLFLVLAVTYGLSQLTTELVKRMVSG